MQNLSICSQARMVDIYHFFKYKITKEKKHISISYISWHTLFKSRIDTPAHGSVVNITLNAVRLLPAVGTTFLPGRAHYKHAASQAMRPPLTQTEAQAETISRNGERFVSMKSTVSLTSNHRNNCSRRWTKHSF